MKVYNWEAEDDFEDTDNIFNLLSIGGLALALIILIGTFLGWI